MTNFKLRDIVTYKKFPYEEDVFIIAADKNTPWKKASPVAPPYFEIPVNEGKDFIILRQNGDAFGIEGIPENGLHVTEAEIELK